MDLSKLKEIISESLELSSQLEDQIGTASSRAYDARRSADDACDYAASARDEAEEAESAADDAGRLRDELQELLEQVDVMLGDEPATVTDVPVLVRRYGDKVRKLKSVGCRPEEIAERLSISPVIVNIILERQEAA